MVKKALALGKKAAWTVISIVGVMVYHYKTVILSS